MNTINDKQQSAKDSIAILANQAKTNIIKNQELLEKINIFKQEIKTVKNLITNFSINSNQKNINKVIAIKYKGQLTLLNTRLKEGINKDLNKQKALHKNSMNELSIENRTLSQLNIDNFILNNTLSKLNFTTKALNSCLEVSKKHEIFREAKRETLIEIKQSKNVFPVYNLELQQKMLSYCRAVTKNKYKNNKKLVKINMLKKNICSLIDVIKFYTSNLAKLSDENKLKPKNDIKNNIKKLDFKKITSQKEKSKTKKLKRTKTKTKLFKKKYEQKIQETNLAKSSEHRQNSFDQKQKLKINISVNNIFNSEGKKKDEEQTERKKINILKIDELLDIDNIEAEDENIIDNELNSDDDVYFEKKLKPKKKISKEYLPILRKDVPIINLSQIEFNKIKIINEADAYSFQKRRLVQNNINWQIKNLKKQIKNLERQISINKNKLNVIHKFIEDVKYNYKLLRPIKVQSTANENPVEYIREKLLDVVGETISKAEKKDGLGTGKKTDKTDKTSIDYEDEVFGSDYSDEDEYIGNYKINHNENENKNIIINNNNDINKENINNNNENKIKTDESKEKEKVNKCKVKHKNKDIKKNLISKFNNEGNKESFHEHNYFDDFIYSGPLSK